MIPIVHAALQRFPSILYIHLWMLASIILMGAPATQASPPASKLHKAYHSNGILSEKGHLDNTGIKTGIWNYYNEAGNNIKRERWKKGELRWQLFFEKGKVVKSIDRKGNIRLGAPCGCS